VALSVNSTVVWFAAGWTALRSSMFSNIALVIS
jgi:hypothetical protein